MNTHTILLVDDDPDLLQVVGRRCESIGLNVQHARNLLTATAVVERHKPDIICIDVQMPTGNGLRFCESLASNPRTAQVPMILLTGQNDDETIASCKRLGAHFAFKSPDVLNTLESLLRRIVAELPSKRPPTVAGIRSKTLPHSIPSLPASDERATSPPTAHNHVIIADDDHDLVQSLLERLRSCDCSAVGVYTAQEAINAINQVQPNLVILDVNMPSGSGLSICEMMASNERLRKVPVIVLTGCSDEDTIRRCHDMLVFYVQKGADIWSRIEPLVFELLHLENTASVARQSEPAPALPVLKTPPPKQTSGTDQQDDLLEAVFAILGADAEGSSTSRNHQAEEAHKQIQQPWILCIDDDFDFSDVLKIRFEEYGVAVARAVNGLAGYRMAFSTPASVILLDFQMPDGQGDYILGRLKDNPITCDIPVFMITGIRDRMLERRVTAMGAAGFFNKPIAFDVLRKRLANYIDALAEPRQVMAKV